MTAGEDVYIHPSADISTTRIGARTKLWQFVVVLPGAVIGTDCNICSHCFIESDVVIGDRVTVKCGVQIWDGTVLEHDVFVGPNVTFTNDAFPRSKSYSKQPARTTVRRSASIGANATILPGLVIGANAIVGAGAVVTRDVPPNAIVVGNPAHITGYVDTIRSAVKATPAIGSDEHPSVLTVESAALYRMPLVKDLRGALTFGQVGGQLPFEIKRYFLVFDVPNQEVRGEHAHHQLHEFLICLRGSCAIALDDGQHRDEVALNSPTLGLHVPPKVWRVHYKYSHDAMLLVFASDLYLADDYIRDYDEFLAVVGATK